MKERKRKLRKQIALQKTQHSASSLEVLSAAVLAQLEAHPVFLWAHTLLLYHSLEDEVHTHAFIQKWATQKRIILPVVVGCELELRLYTGPNDLSISTYGIAEPAGEPFIDYAAIDLAIIPGVAFDSTGSRLGRGKGYYDKLLPHIAAFKIGICFPFQLINQVPTEAFDIRMDAIISQ